MDLEFDRYRYKLKTVFELRKECQTFKSQFELSNYERSLYLSQIREMQVLKPMRKHEMLKI